MQQLLDSNPDAQPYAALVHEFLWGSLAPTVFTIALFIAIPRIINVIMNND